MGIFDEDGHMPANNPKPVQVGEDLSQLSEADLKERIAQLQREIERTEATLSERSKIRDAAKALFAENNVK
ncbi:hypothetical protein GCM10011316_00890 [Roseibium aquae]|uniref:DUF1192 domain-containing protein n=1 Tax=Roseibium aquae TaxID=1323746 RepID=A0A916T787_9HYPH|nr:DUF1192 domain-containing protein [Roseibium aquae]GGB32610.1 hypothetical protein GCM10011316_00890 [Roseibium aquae]